MEDLIKRTDAIEAVEFGITYAKIIDSDGWTKPLFENENRELKKAIERIKNIPSVEPTIEIDADQLAKLLREGWTIHSEQKQGEWLFKEITDDYHVTGQCSICKERKRIDNFCPNCGARMKEQ